MPGIDGGLKRSQVCVSAWSSEELEVEGDSFKDSSGEWHMLCHNIIRCALCVQR